jgi:hypothetical protein
MNMSKIDMCQLSNLTRTVTQTAHEVGKEGPFSYFYNFSGILHLNLAPLPSLENWNAHTAHNYPWLGQAQGRRPGGSSLPPAPPSSVT